MQAPVSPAAISALHAAHRSVSRPLDVGQRVVFTVGSHWLYGTIHRLIEDHEGEPAADLQMGGVWYHRERLNRLRPVCGVCTDCLHVNQNPGCAQ